jgi:hypothetical protein
MNVTAIISASLISQSKVEVVDDIANSNLIITWPAIDNIVEKELTTRLVAPISCHFGSTSQIHSDILACIDDLVNNRDMTTTDCAVVLMFGAIHTTMPKKTTFVSFVKHDNDEHCDKVIADLEGKRLYLPIEIIYSNDVALLRESLAKIIDNVFTSLEATAKITNKEATKPEN